jgi:hypothetical protein
MKNAIEQNGVMIARTPGGIGVAFGSLLHPPAPNKVLAVEVSYLGRKLKQEFLQTYGPPWRDHFGSNVDHLKCAVRVMEGPTVIAELDEPFIDRILPFMVVQGEQVHITENYVSVPPSLHITDEVGAVWTLGFTEAPKDQSPKGEFAFPVLRDGVNMREIASRIERRNGTVRIFTKNGWKRWLGSSFS